MRAVILPHYGPPEALQLAELPSPTPGTGELLIDAYAAAVNPVDYKMRSGGQRGALRYTLPIVLGMDVSGVVSAVGPGVTEFQVGDAVISTPSHKVMGCYAEQVVIPADQCAKKPEGLSHVDAAGLPLAGMTAWRCLHGMVKPGDRVLIHAGSGGVGTLAIQLAKDLGAWVATTCSARNAQLVRDLGADRVIDYQRERFEEVLEPVDLVLDSLGGETRERSWAALKRGGRMRSITTGMPENTERYGPTLGTLATVWGVVVLTLSGLVRGKPAANLLRACDGQQLAAFAARVEAGAVRPVTDRVFPLAQAAEAHRYQETGRARGKVILAIREAP